MFVQTRLHLKLVDSCDGMGGRKGGEERRRS
jgi:hypothetical protein